MTKESIPAFRIQKELQKQIVPIYLVLGPDLYLRKYVLDAFINSVDPGLRDFNVSRFAEGDLQRCLDAARTLPMVSPRRLVILEDISNLKEADWEVLYAYLENPNARTVLLLMASKLHQARVNKIAKAAALISAAEPSWAEARAMVEKSFRKDGYEVQSGTVDELLDHAGTSMQAVAQEVEKLKLYKLDEKTIGVEDVIALSNRVRPHDIWDLTNQLATRNRRQLLLLLHRMLDGGAPPLVLLKSMYSHFAGLLIVKELAGKTQPEISRLTGMNSYQVRRLVEQSHKFTVEEVSSALKEVHKTDSALKGSGISEKLLLESLLIRIVAQIPDKAIVPRP